MTDLNKEKELHEFEDFLKKDFPDLFEKFENGNYFANLLRNSMLAAWVKAKAQAVPEGRTDVEIIKQTIGLVDLIAKANRFERNKTAALPFESNNPRVKEWWTLACEIQDLLTQTDPNNCDFEEYKDLVASESGAEG